MRKTTVQECLTIDVGTFRKMKPQFTETRRGVLHFGAGHAGDSTIGFSLHWEHRRPFVRLRYEIDQEPIQMPILLVTTDTQFGGLRWWLRCPLAVNGTPCQLRAGKLYLPPGGSYFGCRECHGLAYRSSQEAHGMERLSARFGLPMETSRLIAESLKEST